MGVKHVDGAKGTLSSSSWGELGLQMYAVVRLCLRCNRRGCGKVGEFPVSSLVSASIMAANLRWTVDDTCRVLCPACSQAAVHDGE